MNPTIHDFLASLAKDDPYGDQVVHHEILPERAESLAQTRRPWPRLVQGLLASRSISKLYSHQAMACDLVRAGRHVVVATPTASGKSLTYTLPVIEQSLAMPDSKALWLFPLKALAQDQLRSFNELTALLPPDLHPGAAIYDGDTPDHRRRKLREDPPGVLLTNPEMLHLSLLPHHSTWAAFWAGLTHVVVDEVHTYRGVMGSHMAMLFRRMLRMCRYYGAQPTFVFCSATIGNPGELANLLTNLQAEVILDSGAPQGRRHFLFMDPAASAATAAIRLLRQALERGLRTIVYCQSRKMTELIAIWAAEKSGEFKERISAYRAGFLPEERREVETRMASGDLLAVVTTSALELGIDIGSLDLCILVGYPGTIMATLQRGGRVGRKQQESAVVLIAQEDALDQYFLRHPEDFFNRPSESAVLNPANPVIVTRHLDCAAAELPLRMDEPMFQEEGIAQVAQDMLQQGMLLQSADGRQLHSRRKRPHREVDLRGAGGTMVIEVDGQVIGQVDEYRAFREAHDGAVYLHRGETFVVDRLDLPGRRALAHKARVGYYTRVRGEKDTEILRVHGSRQVLDTRVHHGRLRVTETITGYEKRRTSDGKMLTIVPLELPPQSYETEGLWIEIPSEIQAAAEEERHHFMGGIHAVEHAAIGILPLLVMCDRNDLGGISIPFHPQVNSATVFVYDGAPGGVGLSRLAFTKAEELLVKTLAVVRECPCELGCPSCVHSPKCGSGNRPISKDAAAFVLELLCGESGRALPSPNPTHQGGRPPGPAMFRSDEALADSVPIAPERIYLADTIPPVGRRPTGERGGGFAGALAGKDAADFPTDPEASPGPSEQHPPAAQRGVRGDEFPRQGSGGGAPSSPSPSRFVVLDVETRRSAAEVGGWHRARDMGVSVAVAYDSTTDVFHTFGQDELDGLCELLSGVELVVGFNVRRFDYAVLSGCVEYDFLRLKTLDMLEHVKRRLGYRLALDHLASATLGAGKSADGLQALAWWKEGRVDLIAEYCRADVRITRDLYLFGRDKGHLLFKNKAGSLVRLPVDWTGEV
ncbi:DEAD/DEAH box helicase [Desulfocurvibacter africanus]|uniref:DEAD/DEAH box helicase domain protein n=3 Tax=Desulfocurvibacter africanus TaxID=873 RepID=F3YYZ4_DESAF|nr:DEAD/DEAH box helicase [Desulfocurvibacter africanus]EGJ49639.1 Protein of unknown function DUF1998 [Desulfocurvibacter africanus subsp. africanus str. Walvis Bay]